MVVHERAVGMPMRGMDTADNPGRVLVDGADPEWVTDLLDTMAEGDPDATAEVLKGMALRLRKAGKPKHPLASIPSASIRAAFDLRAKRREAEPCR